MSRRKLTDTVSPPNKVSAIIKNAAAKGYAQLPDAHKKGYANLSAMVNLIFGSVLSQLTTDFLLKNYKEGIIDKYLEELYFQYGRYIGKVVV